MSNPVISQIPSCPYCDLPMIPDASEARPSGVTKLIFHCPACRMETDRFMKAAEPTKPNQATA